MEHIKKKVSKFMEKIKPKNKKQKMIWLAGAAAALLLMIAAVLTVSFMGKPEEVTYKEKTVVRGNLAAGVTESGNVDVGTTVQKFELDISAFTGETSFSFGGSMGGGMGGELSAMMQGQTQSASSADRSLEIEEVYVEAGEEITEGTPLLLLTAESVETIRSGLASDVTEAELVYQQALTAEKQSLTSAEGQFKINSLYGVYSDAEYAQAVSGLAEAVTEAEEDLAEAQDAAAEAEQELSEKEALLAEEKQVLANAQFTAEGTDKETALYWWIVAYQTAEDAGDMVEALEEEIEQLKEDINTYTKEIAEKETALLLAEKALESGEITAKGQLDKRTFNAEHAQEIYDVAVEQSAYEKETAKADFEEAEAKLEEFDSVIVDQVISASESGVITDVYVSAGDYLTRDSDLISLNNYDEMTITVSVEEDSMETVISGSKVNVTLAAFEDVVFAGTVTEIGDAEIDSSTNKTLYSVTVTIEDTGKLLYQDMTAEVTFVSDEVSEVLYVPVRTILEEDGVSCVKVKEADGSIHTREVVTGFSDGVNIEIKEGLSEGEIVLQESGGKKS